MSFQNLSHGSTILITGSAGAICANLVLRLAESSHPILANRNYSNLADVLNKVYTRDIFELH